MRRSILHKKIVSREAYDVNRDRQNAKERYERLLYHRSGEYCSCTLRVPLMLLRGEEFMMKSGIGGVSSLDMGLGVRDDVCGLDVLPRTL
jgi:hypothetical protein